VMICGGVDDFSEEGSAEFANMKATSNSLSEFAQGRTPSEMSRPTTSSRAGFMEAQGSGVQILMQASLAIEMGVPIYGILGLTNTSMDKQGRSVPAPGQGVLTTAKEVSGTLSPRLDLKYRRRQLEFRRKQIGEWLEHEHHLIQDELLNILDKDAAERYLKDQMTRLQQEAKRQENEALETWGTGFYKNDPKIAPLRGSLASFGLTIDDVSVVSFHGTSTVANDKNESDVTNKQFSHLGRSKGNGCAVIAQKWLTGHPKGAAAAWMTNGLIQTILTGLIPGNRNADNIAPELEKYEYLYFPSRSLQTDGIKAGILKSFGFGQVGGEAVIIHPEYLLCSLNEVAYQSYKEKNIARWQKSYRVLQDAMVHENLIKLKNSPPYEPELESAVLLDPLQRAVSDHKGNYSFVPRKSVLPNEEIIKLPEHQFEGVGIDSELITALSLNNENFVKRNYTANEIAECDKKPDPKASYVGRWCAKEAVVKAISSYATKTNRNVTTTKGAGAPLIDIEILSDAKGVPQVSLHGFALELKETLGIRDISLSITHADSYAVAIALAHS
jgi:fatty acid synthase subunit alpha